MRTAECRWATDVIRVNGVLDEIAWRGRLPRDFAVFWQKHHPPPRPPPACSGTIATSTSPPRWRTPTSRPRQGEERPDLERRRLRAVLQAVGRQAGLLRAPGERGQHATGAFLPSRRRRRLTPLRAHAARAGVGGALQGTLNKWDDRDRGWAVEGRIPWSAFKATGGRPRRRARGTSPCAATTTPSP